MNTSIAQSLLIVIDVQGKLAEIMHDREHIVKNILGLIQAARILNIPILYTEQLPQKIGPTIKEVKEFLTQEKPIEKSSFSCCGSTEFNTRLRNIDRDKIILCGIETHVCLYQTAVDLKQRDFQVEVVVDATSSRTLENKNIALDRLKSQGVSLTSTEMIITELIKGADHPKFRDVLNLIK